ncbi:MAG: YhbY family RNA-binding protein [Euryarchaeota archaeon]|nr:YhbY family RNA-binding protein [Euryarchaeota archaeon]
MLSSKEKKRFRRELHRSRASVIIGKGGASSAIAEVDRQLEERELIKVKVLRSASAGKSTAEIAKEIADATQAEVVEVIGKTFGLFRPRRKKPKEV